MPRNDDAMRISDSDGETPTRRAEAAKPGRAGDRAKRRIDFSNQQSQSDVESEDESEESTGAGEEKEQAGGSDSGSEFSSGSDDDDDDDEQDRDDAADDPDGKALKLDPQLVGVTAEELEDDDVELWLLRMPRHDLLDEQLYKMEIELPPAAAPDAQKQDRICGTYRGSYAYRDHGAVLDKHVRAAFVVPKRDGSGEGEMVLGKPFSKMLSVTYDTDLVDVGKTSVPPRTYPAKPLNLSQKYFAIGGTKKKDVLEQRARMKREAMEVLVEDARPVQRRKSTKVRRRLPSASKT